MTDDIDARLKGVRRDFATEFENIEAAISKIGKQVRGKMDTDDGQALSLKVSNVETDSRDGMKNLKAEVQDLKQSLSRSMAELANSVNAMSETLTTFRREADGRTTDTVNRVLSERKQVSGPVWATGGVVGGGSVIGALVYLITHGVN